VAGHQHVPSRPASITNHSYKSRTRSNARTTHTQSWQQIDKVASNIQSNFQEFSVSGLASDARNGSESKILPPCRGRDCLAAARGGVRAVRRQRLHVGAGEPVPVHGLHQRQRHGGAEQLVLLPAPNRGADQAAVPLLRARQRLVVLPRRRHRR
jgi:hypothetical protein